MRSSPIEKLRDSMPIYIKQQKATRDIARHYPTSQPRWSMKALLCLRASSALN